MTSYIETFLEKYYGENAPIILGCSTGPDSMYILYHILETKYAKNLVACYFNHKLRVESDEEEQWLENLGKKRWFTVEVAQAKIKEIRDKFYPSKGIEEVAREKRYAFFNALCNIYQTNKVITAHHLDDKIETFFFNLARGSKLTGLINMTEYSGWILRPLLNISKQEILEYLDIHNLEYKIDESNNDTSITRNYVRHEIIPKFSHINESYKSHISNTLNYFEAIQKHINQEVEDFLHEQGIKIFNSGEYKINTLEIYGYFYIQDFHNLSDFLQKEIIRHCFFISNNNSTIGLSEANIAEILKFIRGKNNKTIKEIKKLKMKKENKIIIF